jgi:surface polysaccharide O-acyltransferase-like enzyme
MVTMLIWFCVFSGNRNAEDYTRSKVLSFSWFVLYIHLLYMLNACIDHLAVSHSWAMRNFVCLGALSNNLCLIGNVLLFSEKLGLQ